MAFNIPAGGSAKTKTPSITIVDNTSGVSVDFTVTNNDGKTAVLVYEIDDTTPDLYSIELATSTTSGTLTLSGLSDNTSYTIYCFGISADKVKSIIASQGFTTPEIVYYELLADTEITGSAVTSVTFSGLSISKTDDVVLVSRIVNTTSGQGYLLLYANNDTTDTNYYYMYLSASDTNIVDTGSYGSYMFYVYPTPATIFSTSNIKLTNDGYFVAQNHSAENLISSIVYRELHSTSIVTHTSITQLDITSSTSNLLGVGSRLQLYKVVA